MEIEKHLGLDDGSQMRKLVLVQMALDLAKWKLRDIPGVSINRLVETACGLMPLLSEWTPSPGQPYEKLKVHLLGAATGPKL